MKILEFVKILNVERERERSLTSFRRNFQNLILSLSLSLSLYIYIYKHVKAFELINVDGVTSNKYLMMS